MGKKVLHRGLLLVMVFLLVGCASAPMPVIVADFADREIHDIALMPVDNKTKDEEAVRYVRTELFEALYFKGYPKTPLETVDEEIKALYKDSIVAGGGHVSPTVVGDLLDVDAVMYCTLREWDMSNYYLYGSVSVVIALELRSAQSGETLWSESGETTVRQYDITGKRLEEKGYRCCESAAKDLLARLLQTLPAGPLSPGTPPPEEPWWHVLKFWKLWSDNDEGHGSPEKD